MTHQDVVNVVAGKRVVGGQDRATGISKDVSHAFALQTFPNDFSTCLLHTIPFVYKQLCPTSKPKPADKSVRATHSVLTDTTSCGEFHLVWNFASYKLGSDSALCGGGNSA